MPERSARTTTTRATRISTAMRSSPVVGSVEPKRKTIRSSRASWTHSKALEAHVSGSTVPSTTGATSAPVASSSEGKTVSKVGDSNRMAERSIVAAKAPQTTTRTRIQNRFCACGRRSRKMVRTSAFMRVGSLRSPRRLHQVP